MDPGRSISRRGFLKSSGAAVMGGSMVSGTSAEEAHEGRLQETGIREYRRLGRTGFQVSDIGFGTGNLDNANVLAVALDQGMNYIDTAEHYVNGRAESTVGEVLGGRDRSSLFITTKINISHTSVSRDRDSKEGIKERFRQCLARMRTNYADCLMIHLAPSVAMVAHEGFHAAFKELKAEGRVRFLGLSNHGMQHAVYGGIEESMEDVIGAAAQDGRFDVALFVYNFLQKEQGERIIEACRARDMGVTLMKTDPVGIGSILAERLEGDLQAGRQVSQSRERVVRDYMRWTEAAEEFKARHGLRTESEVRDAATKFCLENSGVHTLCATINSFDVLESFLALSGRRLTQAEEPVLASYAQLLGPFYCRHGCGICEPACPRGVLVNDILRYGHYFDAQRRQKQAMQKYASLGGMDARECLGCDAPCEAACPFGVPARALLARAHRRLTLA
ncbi:MAG: aldo/keto reductase [Longimicrobiales bacterium]